MASSAVQFLRVKQYLKNGLIFIPLVFYHDSFKGIEKDLDKVFLTFIIFCLASSFVYIVNDINDIERDKVHPVKAKRPIASGKITKLNAAIAAAVLLVISSGAAYSLNLMVFVTLLLYIGNNIAYTFYLKSHFLFDIFSISFGFLLRIFAGAAAINVAVSEYLFLIVFFLSLYLGAGKRRYETLLLGDDNIKHRPALEGYSVYYLDQLMLISSTITLVVYSLYTIGSTRGMLIFTVPIVTLGLFRYYNLTHNMNKGEPSDDIISDKIIIGAIVAYFSVIFINF